MRIVLRILRESVSQALHQLWANKLRSFLSLLGICVGIFCIIAVMSAVDSLEDNIKGSFEQLGNDMLYISKLPWAEDPGQSYWKYFQRPVPSIEDYTVLKERVQSAQAVSFLVRIGSRTIKYRSNNVEGAFVMASTFEYGDMFSLPIEKGRYFSPHEYEMGSNRIIMGSIIAQELFGSLDPIGKSVKLMGKSMLVIGVIRKSGKALINPFDYDEAVMIPYTLARQVADVRMRRNPWGTQLNVKAAAESNLDDLRDEVTGTLRAHRRLKPREKDDFALNEISIITRFLDSIFNVLNLAGVVIGLFAILVGMFSVANIMFVSVKERTRFIGIKKALGARRYFILLEFLVEAVVLCILGGLIGLGLVFLVMKGISQLLEFDMFLSLGNVLIGLILSILIGVLSGVIPAYQAAKLDPVDAMRK
ncbi:MAG: FtsX-like permease family protein [Saprospiraceae bacterium]|nr:FtsX-like permease family protein [Saprospiraceae bacterium]